MVTHARSGERTHDESKRRRSHHKGAHYIPMAEREFIAWDGEGEHPKNAQGKYLLFGCSTGEDISTPDETRGLRASECFKLMIDVAERYPYAIHMAFAFNYDVTMMIASLPEKVREKVARNEVVWWKNYRIENLTRKWFKLYDKKRKISITVYDIFTFFGCSALQAWREYLPGDEDLSVVEKGKAGRDSFTYSDMSFLRQYMHRELVLYRKLVTKLRTLLQQLGIVPTGWYGPGAVASAFLKFQGIKNHRTRELPEDVIQASQHAYFGGRFEAFRTGLYHGRVYKNDIRSAYPHALRQLPSLTQGEWVYRASEWMRGIQSRGLSSAQIGTDYIRAFSLYKVSYRGNGDRNSLAYHNVISPFPYRDFRGLIHFPRRVEGWYWGVEVQSALKHSRPGEVELLEAWEYIPYGEAAERPFAFIEGLYEQRARWKSEGNPVQLAAKLVMNSLYGKLAQRIGWNEETNEPPTWHQLEYAGYATACCRSMVYDIMAMDPDSIIAVETDGIFSTRPLELPSDTGALGDWEVEEYEGIAYVQSGVYCLRGGPKQVPGSWSGQKMRGFSKGDFDVSDVLDSVQHLSPITAHTHRFAALRQFWGDDRLTTWIDNTHTLVWGGGGKREHHRDLCRTCLQRTDAIGDGMHDCYIGSGGGISEKHILPWRTDNRQILISEVNTALNRIHSGKVGVG